MAVLDRETARPRLPVPHLGPAAGDEDALRASEVRLARMFDLAPIGMAVVDGAGLLTRVNHALCTLLGTDEPGLLGQSLDGIVADGPLHREVCDELGRQERRVVEAERRLVGREPVWGQLSVSALEEDADAPSLLVQVVDVTERKRMEAELAHRAQHDHLTGLPNRAALLSSLDEALEQARAGDGDVAVLFCDLDGFKLVNDTFGHEVGDALLRAVAKRLAAGLPDGDLLARFGGDEFVILHRGCDGADGAVAYADGILDRLAEPITIANVEVPVKATIGVALAAGGQGRGSTLIRDADTAMYDAKAHSPGTVRVCQERLRTAVAARFTIQAELRRAVSAEEFRLHYQPIVRPDGDLAGLEALVRWEHPRRGLLDPQAFLATAEDTGLIVPIGRWVLGAACRELAELTATGAVAEDVGIWVNVSGVELADPSLPRRVRAALEEARLPPQRLTLEISEHTMLGEVMRELDQLCELGVGLAVDDLGAGRTPIGDLVRAPVSVAKIDQSLIRGLAAGHQARGVVKALFDLARCIGVQVVAEGVETRRERDLLTAMGCDLLQGYGIAAPAPARSLGLRESLRTIAPAGCLAG